MATEGGCCWLGDADRERLFREGVLVLLDDGATLRRQSRDLLFGIAKLNTEGSDTLPTHLKQRLLLQVSVEPLLVLQWPHRVFGKI